MLAILVANAPAPGVAPREALLNFLRQRLEKCIALEHTYYAALNEAGFKDEDISYCDEDSVLHCSRCNRELFNLMMIKKSSRVETSSRFQLMRMRLLEGGGEVHVPICIPCGLGPLMSPDIEPAKKYPLHFCDVVLEKLKRQRRQKGPCSP